MSQVKSSTVNKELTSIQKELNSAVSNASSSDSKKQKKVQEETQDIIDKINDSKSLSDSEKEKLLGAAESLNSLADSSSTSGSDWEDATAKMSDLINSTSPDPEEYSPKSEKDKTKFDEDDIEKAYNKVMSDVGKGSSLEVGKLKQDVQNLLDRVQYSDLTSTEKENLTNVVNSMMDAASQSGKADEWNTAASQIEGFLDGSIDFSKSSSSSGSTSSSTSSTATASDLESLLETATSGTVSSDDAKTNAMNLLDAIQSSDFSTDEINQMKTAAYAMVACAGQSSASQKWNTNANIISQVIQNHSSSSSSDDSDSDNAVSNNGSDAYIVPGLNDSSAPETVDSTSSSSTTGNSLSDVESLFSTATSTSGLSTTEIKANVQSFIDALGSSSNLFSSSDITQMTRASYSLLVSAGNDAMSNKWSSSAQSIEDILSKYSSSGSDTSNSNKDVSDNTADTYIIPGINS